MAVGSVANGSFRAPVRIYGSDLTYALNVSLIDFFLWTDVGDYVVNDISNVYGSSDNADDDIHTLAPGATPTTFTDLVTLTASPTGWVSPTYPAWVVGTTGYGSESSLPCLGPSGKKEVED